MVDKLADQFTTSAVTQRTRPALAFDLLAALVTSGPARADIATPARKGCDAMSNSDQSVMPLDQQHKPAK